MKLPCIAKGCHLSYWHLPQLLKQKKFQKIATVAKKSQDEVFYRDVAFTRSGLREVVTRRPFTHGGTLKHILWRTLNHFNLQWERISPDFLKELKRKATQQWPSDLLVSTVEIQKNYA